MPITTDSTRGIFSIVGAPRCGTTAFSAYLESHPDVCFSKPKEPHYFNSELLDGLTSEDLRARTEAQFVAHFWRHCQGTERVLGEASVSYLYVPDAARKMLAVWPQTKFVIMVRSPLDMLKSYHLQMLYTGDETEVRFERAWRLTAERSRGEKVPRSCRTPFLLRYDEIGRLGHYVSAFMDALGRERCHVVVYDDFIADPRGTYLKLLDFLGLEDDGRKAFPRVKSGRLYRIGWLHRAVKRPPSWLAERIIKKQQAKIWDRVWQEGTHYRPPWQRVKKLGSRELRKKLIRLNTKDYTPPPLSAEMRRELSDFFREDVARLGRLLDRDLNHWLEPAATEAEQAHGRRIA